MRKQQMFRLGLESFGLGSYVALGCLRCPQRRHTRNRRLAVLYSPVLYTSHTLRKYNENICRNLDLCVLGYPIPQSTTDIISVVSPTSSQGQITLASADTKPLPLIDPIILQSLTMRRYALVFDRLLFYFSKPQKAVK
jgi:hypothetical protein